MLGITPSAMTLHPKKQFHSFAPQAIDDNLFIENKSWI